MFCARTFSLGAICLLMLNGIPSAYAADAGKPATATPNSSLLLKKSYDQMISGDFREAVDTQILAVKANRDSVDARRYLSYSLLRIGASDEAIDQLHFLLSMTKALPVDMCMCGEACLQAGQYRQAEVWYKEALIADPSLVSAKTGLSHVAAARKRNAPVVLAKAKTDEKDSNKAKEEPKTTYEQGLLNVADASSVPANRMVKNAEAPSAFGTQSLASVTAQHLRSSQQQQVTSVAIAPARPLGNNQQHNAWENYKGVQRR